MAHLLGREYTKAELLRYVGDISQIARAKPYRLIEGHEDGVLAIDVTTGSGFDFTVLPSCGTDISSATYKGRSLAWRSSLARTFSSCGRSPPRWVRAGFSFMTWWRIWVTSALRT